MRRTFLPSAPAVFHLTVRSHGVGLGVRSERAEFLERVRSRLPVGWEPAPRAEVRRWFSLRESDTAVELAVGRGRTSRHATLDEALDRLESETELFVAEWSRSAVFVHAAVAAVGGRAVVIPGRSFSGKSTLAAALVQAGADYLSDEFALVDSAGRVHPYPRRLSLRQPPRRVKASDLGGRTCDRPLPVGLVLLTRFDSQARWQPSECTAGKGLVELIDHAVPIRRRPAEVIAALGNLAATARIVAGTRGEADEVVEYVFAALS